MNFETVYSQILFEKNVDPILIDLVFIHFKINPDNFKTHYISHETNYESDHYKSDCYKTDDYYSEFELEGPDYYEYDYYTEYESEEPDSENDYYAEYGLENQVYYNGYYSDESESADSVNSVPYDFDLYDD